MEHGHTTSRTRLRRNRIQSWALRIGGLALLLFGLLAGPRESEAKLDPYYILRGQNFAQFQPRILIAMDTSGSMTWVTNSSFADCLWNNC